MQPTYTQFQDLIKKHGDLKIEYERLKTKVETLEGQYQQVEKGTTAESRISKCEVLANRSLFEREISLWTLGKMLIVVIAPGLIWKVLNNYADPEAKRLLNTDADVYIFIALYLMLAVGFEVMMFNKPAQ